MTPDLASLPDAGALVPALPSVDVPRAVAAVQSHDWQAVATVALPVLAWALRRFEASPVAWVHSKAAGIVIPFALALVGALAPVLDSGHFTIAALVSAVTVAIGSMLAVSNPSTAAIDDPMARPRHLPMSMLVGALLLSSVAHADPMPTAAKPIAALPSAPVALVAAAPVAPQSVDPVTARLAALNDALAALQAKSGAPVGIPPSFWDTKAGQVLAVTLTVATIVTSAAGSAAGVYAAVK